MNHFQILKECDATLIRVANKTLEDRLLGRFYTPQTIVASMVRKLLPHLRNKEVIRVCDPFAGDGRLVLKLTQELNAKYRKVQIETQLWDCDERDLAPAAERIKRVDGNIVVSTMVTDSFNYVATTDSIFDVVITNPPWEILKPDHRELGSLDNTARVRYIEQLKQQDTQIRQDFCHSQPARKISGWGTNLSRVGLEASLRLLAPNGLLAIVLPASFCADDNSTQLRKWLVENFDIKSADYYPAEAKLFAGVDQSFVTLLAQAGTPTKSFIGRNYMPESGKLSKPYSSTPLDTDGYRLNVGPAIVVGRVFHALPCLGQFEGLNDGQWWFGRELDETRDKPFLSDVSGVPFVKGRAITAFEEPKNTGLYLNTRLRAAPRTSRFLRVAWRDVSRPTMRRRMCATIVEPNSVSGNSLNIAMANSGQLQHARALCVLMNSVWFEAQVRAWSHTSHVSAGTVRKVRVPNLLDDGVLAKLASLYPGGEADIKEPEREAGVAAVYGLSKSEMKQLLTFFPRLEAETKKAILNARIGN